MVGKFASDLQEIYDVILKDYHFDDIQETREIYGEIRHLLTNYMRNHKRVGIYCYGEHTKHLMVDFVYELRNIVCIIDNGDICTNSQGFKIIKDYDIEALALDGIIVSSYKYRDEVKKSLKDNHKGVEVLDIYDYLDISREFYAVDSAYSCYKTIHDLHKKNQKEPSQEILLALVKEYLKIKDFRLASEISKELYGFTNEEKYNLLYQRIKCLYDNCLSVLRNANQAVCLICVDGLRGIELSRDGKLNKTYETIKKRGKIFSNAYSYSTSTYETLIPVFTEKIATKSLGDVSEAEASECRFVQHARRQGRTVYIYGSDKYIVGDGLKHKEGSFTITQLLWYFILDLCKEGCGLFYLQPVYESHFTFPSPYFTGDELILDGTSILYDYTGTKGEKIRGEYVEQYDAAIKYIDDTLAPVIEALSCKTMLFADHGNYDYRIFDEKDLSATNPVELVVGKDLFHIPLAIVSSNEEKEENNELISLMEFNEIVISLLDGCEYKHASKKWIHIARTPIYNPDYKYIFSNIFDAEYLLCAFEGFVFPDGMRLMVFSDKTKILLDDKGETSIADSDMIEKYFSLVEGNVTIL